MRVSTYRLAILRVPLHEPFRTALRQVNQVEDVVLVLESSCGRMGYGSAPATQAITGEDHGSIIASLENTLLPWAMRQEFEGLTGLRDKLAALVSDNVNARCALEVALFDLAAQVAGEPLYAFLGGSPQHLHTGITVSVGEPSAMAEGAQRALARGFRSLKLKVGGAVADDVARVARVAAAIGADGRIYLDANQAWSAREAIEAITTIEGLGIACELVEQPVPAEDIEGLSQVRAAVNTPVMADESVFNCADARQIIDRAAADILNIKLVKSGGIEGALQIVDVAAEAGIKCMMGCMLESAVGVSAAAHLAAACASTITRVDLDAPVLCRENPLSGGAVFDGPGVALNQTPGLGIEGIRGLEYLQAGAGC
jgi:L-Ala-D/L-Glu epimerase / N-acetyl-D-glutamate racemase